VWFAWTSETTTGRRAVLVELSLFAVTSETQDVGHEVFRTVRIFPLGFWRSGSVSRVLRRHFRVWPQWPVAGTLRELPVARRTALRSSVPSVYRPAAPESVEWGGHPTVPPVTEVADGGPNRVSGRNTDRNR